MKNKIIGVILITISLLLIIVGAIFGFDKDKNVEKEKPYEGYIGKAENYSEIGSKNLKEEQIFDNIKYTQNHLSTTSATSYASFTSVIYNETGQVITDQHIEIDFYNAETKLLGTIESSIENLGVGESTVIYGIVETDLSTSNSFVVRQVAE